MASPFRCPLVYRACLTKAIQPWPAPSWCEKTKTSKGNPVSQHDWLHSFCSHLVHHRMLLLSIDGTYKVLSGNHRWTIMKQLVSLLACFSILVFVFCYVYSDFSLFAYCIFRLLLASARASVLSYELHFAGDGSIHQHNRNTLPSSRTRY